MPHGHRMLNDTFRRGLIGLLLLILGAYQYGWALWPSVGFWWGVLNTAIIVSVIGTLVLKKIPRRIKIIAAWIALTALLTGEYLVTLLPAQQLQEAHRVEAKQQTDSATKAESYTNNRKNGIVGGSENKTNADATETTEKVCRSSEYWSPFGRCLKITDCFLALFTFILCLIGFHQWKMSRVHERAYIVCCGMFGVPKDDKPSLRQIHRPKATDFDPPWQMMIFNHGRTPGYITKIQWGILQYNDFRGKFGIIPEEMYPSDVIKDPRFQGIITLQETQDVFPPTGNKPIKYRYVSRDERNLDEVFFGRIDYEDVFGKPHHSAFAFLFRAEHTDTVGIAFSRDKS